MQYWKKAAALCAIMVTAGGVSMAAEPAVYTLGPVVVTANRTETPELDTNADVTVVTREEIQKNHYEDVTDAIKNVPGVTMMNQGGNGQTYMSNSLYINGSENVVLLVDGMRQNINGMSIGSHAQPGSFVNMNSVERIEVLKGAASTLYGSDAQGGVINIITRKPKDGEVNSQAGIAFGSYDGEKYNLYNEGSKDGFFWTVDAQKQIQGDFEDGWGRDVVNHLNSKALNVKVGKDLGNDSDITFGYQKYESDYTIPGTQFVPYLYGSNSRVRADGNKDVERISAKYNAKINNRLKNQFSLYRNRTELNDMSSGSPLEFKMKTLGISDQLIYTTDNHLITGGVDYYKDKVDHYFGAGNDAAASGKSISNTAFYVQDIWQVASKWDVTPGIRIDHNSEFGNHTSPSLVIGYKPGEKTKVYASYKEFFIAPDMYQMYTYTNDPEYGITKGNPDLDPITGKVYELGIHHQFNDTTYGTFSVYRQFADNLISFESGKPYSTYTNTGKRDSWGWSASLKKNFTEHFTATLGYTYTRFDPQDSIHNANLNGILPESTINVGLDYRNAKLIASLSGRGIMNRKGNYSNTKDLSEYGNFWVWDLAANYAVTPQATVYARVNNIFDQFYTEVIGYAGPYDSGWYSAPGRNFEAGVQFKF